MTAADFGKCSKIRGKGMENMQNMENIFEWRVLLNNQGFLEKDEDHVYDM